MSSAIAGKSVGVWEYPRDRIILDLAGVSAKFGLLPPTFLAEVMSSQAGYLTVQLGAGALIDPRVILYVERRGCFEVMRVTRSPDRTVLVLRPWQPEREDWGFAFQERHVGRVVVAQTHLPNGYLVSTVWLGVDRRAGPPGVPSPCEGSEPVGEEARGREGGPSVSFETVVFLDCGEREALDGRRYVTEVAAREGHADFEHRWRMKRRASVW